MDLQACVHVQAKTKPEKAEVVGVNMPCTFKRSAMLLGGPHRM